MLARLHPEQCFSDAHVVRKTITIFAPCAAQFCEALGEGGRSPVLTFLKGGHFYGKEIQRELSSLFRTLKDPRVQGGMVTITHVDTTTDLRYCRVFVSVLDKTQEKDVIRGLKSAAGYLRRELGMAMSLRYTPELQFTADDSIEYGAHILEMLRDPTKVKPANPANEHIVLDGEEE